MISSRRDVLVLVALLLTGSLVVSAAAPARPRHAPPRPRPAPASLDGGFGSRGVVALGQGYQLFGVATQRDGKVVVTGEQKSRSSARLVVARLTSAGRLDRSFNHGRVLLGPKLGTGNSIGQAVTIQRDGKIVVAGVLTDSSGVDQGGMLVERFTASGALDRRFARGGTTTVLGGTAHGAAFALSLQRDGKIVLAGNALGSDGLARIAVARLSPRGQLDRSFGAGGVRLAQGSQDLGRVAVASAVALQPGGGIVVAGSARPNLQNSNAVLARFTSGGNLDRNFGSGGSFVVPANVLGGGAAVFQALAVGSDGSIVAAGAATSGGVTPAYALAARLASNGKPNRSFGRGGIVSMPSDRGSVAPSPIPGAYGAAITRRGVILLAGSFVDSGQSQVALWSLNSRGSLVASGTTRTRLSKSLASGGANALAIDSAGRIVVAGTSNNFVAYNGLVLRYHGFGR